MDGDKQGQVITDQILPPDMITLQNFLPDTDPMLAMCNSEIIDPVALGFIPKTTWASWKPTSVQGLHDSYFSRKNSVSRRFEHKLWNCLKITSAFPQLTKTIGVQWVTNKIIKVYKHPFAKFLAISCVDGGLFHKQGNFTRHGFIDLSEAEAQRQLTPEQLADVDFRDVHLIMHVRGEFASDASEESIANCRWIDPSPANRVATLSINQPDPLSVVQLD